MRRRAWCEIDVLKCSAACQVRRLTILAVIGVVLLNSGCVFTGPLEYINNGFKVGPNYNTPPAPVAPDWIEANDPRVENRHLDDWWTVFQDPVLDSLIAVAHDKNRSLAPRGCASSKSGATGDLGWQYLPTNAASDVQYSRTAKSTGCRQQPHRAGLPPTSPDPFANHFSNFQGGFTANWDSISGPPSPQYRIVQGQPGMFRWPTMTTCW